MLEWTIDSVNFWRNPIIESQGISEILELMEGTGVQVRSLTSDWFMENPPWAENFSDCLQMHKKICESMSSIGASIIVIPLVDNSSMSTPSKEREFEKFIEQLVEKLIESKVRVAIESDFAPKKLGDFISRFDEETVGINYDIGNSASLGYNPKEEFESYGDRILNVHVKDRFLGGTTTPLGNGNANFEVVFECLRNISYRGNYILQTARATEGENHSEVLTKYALMVESWLT